MLRRLKIINLPWYALFDDIRTSIKESGVIGGLNQLKVILASKEW